ncbi:3-deoxy-manno-octulosonate cytidylyltransferase [Helicobacter sp. MIT 01-3238]|uniref:3-deoxy-manno-octulosonate cytidylyltransferase n=1 Tax=Helicobacter sp. MIT 01-3238 TaxID=398627 RepID=UPI000E1F5323|nr:3-deoxy-manno-octulosonate cytidylyltransferase [Helicobacter sp. MIT 01-3238]RDU52413.1 3-deoxy-manno-octulosonate cytidylyltransferase [Helicobacter sp. MIT 01-3238]
MIIIPARLSSTRFPNKILADIQGEPMLIKTAKNASKIDEVCIACDDEGVLELCKRAGLQALITSKHHQSGTDRCNEAAKKLGLNSKEIIINIQADEPFLESAVIESLKDIMQKGAWMGSCAKVISQSEIENPNLVKVVLNKQNEAIYFSRASIPFWRDKESKSPPIYYGHLGVYGYSAESLAEFCALPNELDSSPLEHIEKLEQLRAIYYGKRIQMTIVQSQSIGIDTKEDLQRALERFG